MEYQYAHFSSQLLIEDMGFSRGPRPGEPFPEFDLETAEGGRIRKSDYTGRPFLMMFGSVTCPMTASARPVIERLHAEFRDRVDFLVLYVREAHPGDRFPQPATFERKIQHARAYQQRDGIPFPVAVDDVEGSLHRQLDPKPNAAYIVDGEGIVASRILWANTDRPLREALRAVTSGMRAPGAERTPRLIPMLRGLGSMDDVLPGEQARRDVMRSAPPMYGLAKLAGVFRPLPPLGRAVAALAVMVAGGVGMVTALRRLASA